MEWRLHFTNVGTIAREESPLEKGLRGLKKKKKKQEQKTNGAAIHDRAKMKRVHVSYGASLNR